MSKYVLSRRLGKGTENYRFININPYYINIGFGEVVEMSDKQFEFFEDKNPGLFISADDDSSEPKAEVIKIRKKPGPKKKTEIVREEFSIDEEDKTWH